MREMRVFGIVSKLKLGAGRLSQPQSATFTARKHGLRLGPGETEMVITVNRSS